MRWARHVEYMEAYRVVVGKPKGKKRLGRPRHKWEDDNNTNMNLKEIGWEVWTWTQERGGWQAVVTAAMNLQVLQYVGNFLTS